MSRSSHLLTLVFVALSGFLMLGDFTALSVALPALGREPGMTPPLLSLVGSMNTLIGASFLILGGRLIDLHGAVRVCMAGLGLYLIGSLLAASAPGATTLIVARAVQGLSFALFGPAGFSKLNTGLPEGPWRNRGLGVYVFSQGVAMIAGSVLGGALTTWFGWRAVFLMNAPVALAALLLAVPVLRKQPETTRPGRLDMLGSMLVAAGTALIIWSLTRVGRPGNSWLQVGLPGAAGLLSYTAFLRHERSAAEPLIPAALLRNRRMIASALASACIMTAAAGIFVLPNLYMQRILGYSAARSGLGMLPQALISMTTGGALAYAVGRYSYHRNLIVATMVYMTGLALFPVLPLIVPHAGYSLLVAVPLLLSSFGGPFGAYAILGNVTGHFPAHHQGLVTSVIMSFQQIGLTVGVALTLTIASSSELLGISAPAALRYAYLACVAAALLGGGCGLGVRSARDLDAALATT